MGIELTDQERQMIEILREWDVSSGNFTLSIERHDGVWDVALNELGTKKGARGAGENFDIAWDNMNPLWA